VSGNAVRATRSPLPNCCVKDTRPCMGAINVFLHMYAAIDNANALVKKGGLIYIALYNDFRGFPSSKTWLSIKRFYANSGRFIRGIMNLMLASQIILFRIIRFQNPIKYVKQYGPSSARGMSFYTDVVDWLGGYPYQYCSVKEVTTFYRKKGFKTIKVNEVNGTGCNEFLFRRI
ncbi:MAG: hypothetical protein KKF65_02820, partial [Nanoarchaeota archaeon]|nr:hypothetical protein [Nanoarchaeota archaeon]